MMMMMMIMMMISSTASHCIDPTGLMDAHGCDRAKSSY